MKKFLFLLCVMVWLPLTAMAETAQVMPGLALEFSLPSDRWTLSKRAPEFLVEELAGRLGEGMLKKARKAGITNAKDAARKMLSANELFIYNEDSGAHLDVDFSAIGADEKPPSKRTVAYSARSAGESLVGEEGLSDVTHKTKKVRVEGARNAYRLDAGFRRLGDKIRFVGVIGFTDPYWFFFYYTDHLKDQRDLNDMERILKSLKLKRNGG